MVVGRMEQAMKLSEFEAKYPAAVVLPCDAYPRNRFVPYAAICNDRGLLWDLHHLEDYVVSGTSGGCYVLWERGRNGKPLPIVTQA